MDRRTELGRFLRSRRARIAPEDAGVPHFGGRRRVPGLRREELAQLAGVSVDHYVRLEQGRGVHFSDEVLDAVARVLRLDASERRHLYDLARPDPAAGAAPSTADGAAPEQAGAVRSGLRLLVASMGDVPAYVLDHRLNVVAWNPLVAELLTDFGALPPERRNIVRLMFLDEAFAELYRDRARKAEDVVAFLRLNAGRDQGDAGLGALVAEMSRESPHFRRLWADHPVKEKTHGRYGFRHPLVGEFDLNYETLRPPDAPNLVLVAYTAEEGSPGAQALGLLASLSAIRKAQEADR
ncbi:helix-turn-helix transcriptional regulator [Nocardiopsis sp. RSe5-2]|uniref:Helix-turn-helix transcriptional regulator n=1 Tax=Nocardiopsis endophytica TaxID=3018445 RepID=A0ABT4UAY0_9ACTN|nr:helix-turn-helix transcriptional regulator [Nocardiopsis endophytica]MDA2813545.1 helix-turn-helix transcriptional regulator [Nocardiopsis endophytica]